MRYTSHKSGEHVAQVALLVVLEGCLPGLKSLEFESHLGKSEEPLLIPLRKKKVTKGID